MFQDVLTLLKHSIGEAGEGDRKYPSFKNQSNEQGLNPSDRRLIQNHRQTPHGMEATDQRYMQRNQHLRSKSRIV